MLHTLTEENGGQPQGNHKYRKKFQSVLPAKNNKMICILKHLEIHWYHPSNKHTPREEPKKLFDLWCEKKPENIVADGCQWGLINIFIYLFIYLFIHLFIWVLLYM
jgi:hypothetical protein